MKLATDLAATAGPARGSNTRETTVLRGAIPVAITEAMFTIAIIALVAVAGACGPRVAPQGPGAGPGDEPGAAAAGGDAAASDSEPAAKQAQASPPVREMLIGEMCPSAAAGRPAVMPLFLRTVIWSDNSDEVAMPIERQNARLFSVLAWDGHRAGVFSVAGTGDVGLDRKAAVGAYAGDSPCKGVRTKAQLTAQTNPTCVAAQADCGLALAVIERNPRPFEEDPDPPDISVSGACVADSKLIVDIDGDGVEEAYPADAFLDPVRAPAEEVMAVSRGSATCTPAFATRNVIPPADPKHWQGLDLLGVVDVDGDSRRELIVSYHYSERRTWAVYSALSTVGRLDLVGEAVPWPTR